MRLELLRPVYGSRAAKVLIDAFTSDPYSWGKALGRAPEMFPKYIEEQYMPEVLKDTVPSFVALNDESGKDCATDEKAVMGTLILEDFHKSDEPTPNMDERSQAIPAILRACHNLFWRELEGRKGLHKHNVGPISYFAFLAVDPGYRRHRVGFKLVEKGVEESIRAGFKVAVAFCTSPKSADLFTKNGFECWGNIVYKEFRLPSDGSIPFQSLPDSTAVMVRFLDDNKELG